MRATAQLTAAPPTEPGGPCRLLRLRDAAPVAWRPTPDAVYLVGTAASPVGDDQVEIDIRVEPGAGLNLRTTAATVAWRASGTGQNITALVADGASLSWHPEPFIATAGCHHRQRTRLAIEGTGRVGWHEELILGRHGEGPGRLDLRLDVDIDGWPLLRHQLELGPGISGWNGPAVIGDRRCVGLSFIAGAGLAHRPAGAGHEAWASWAVLPLDGPGTLTVAVADDLPALHRALAAASALTHGENF